MEDKDILDFDLDSKNKSSYYTKRSFGFMLFSLVLIIINVMVALALITSYPLPRFVTACFPIFSVVFSIAIVLGFFFAMGSLLKKERNSVKKTLGLIGNGILFFLFLLGRVWQFYGFIN